MSANAAARSLGLDPSYFSYVEKGRRRPSLPMLVRISRLFGGVSIDWLVWGDERATIARAGNHGDQEGR